LSSIFLALIIFSARYRRIPLFSGVSGPLSLLGICQITQPGAFFPDARCAATAENVFSCGSNFTPLVNDATIRKGYSFEDASLISRRQFLRKAKWTPAIFLPAPLLSALRAPLAGPALYGTPFAFAETRISPRYPSASPLDDMLRLVKPGTDSYLVEKYVAEIQVFFRQWTELLVGGKNWQELLAKRLQPSLQSNAATGDVNQGEKPRRLNGIEFLKRSNFTASVPVNRDAFLDALRSYFGGLPKISTAEFEVIRAKQISQNPLSLKTLIRYSLVATSDNGECEERTGMLDLQWSRDSTDAWLAQKWDFLEVNTASAASRLFVDVSSHWLDSCASYEPQLLRGADFWRTVLDGASGISVYGNNGVAAGDFDNDGFDDLYICQPSGLPNRLFRNGGDGTFKDVTEESGIGVLNATACALFADFQNRGLQDLLVVCDSGPLLFLNQGNGKFAHKENAFSFAKPPQGTFTHAAIADYDLDGRLDIYFCLYTYYLGLDQYHYPSPYFDARNGPPNYLFHNEGNSTFVDRTEAAGLNIENDRFSFACAWGDMNGNGLPDLYVANDFGRSNLYRNDGNGKFTTVSDSSGSNDVGAGMSACWLDFDNDGKQDIYVSNMWSAAGQRISEQENFHPTDSENLRSFYRQHAAGNSLYKNLGDGNFKNVAVPSGTSLGRWAWSSDSWDFDHDGFSDLYVANGYISGTQPQDLSSFFWRQVVGNSPATFAPSVAYERGWNAINELIRSDHSWSGYERNSLFLNNHDGTFFDVSGISGLDFLDDSRAFSLADLNHDGRLEVILKNRTAPQLRILQNAMQNIGNSVCFRLRGTKSNRDAIGASITIQCGNVRQTKYLQAGTGFLSQHSKELFFGLGKTDTPISATLHWPSGLTQNFQQIPANHRISIEEGQPRFSATPFSQYEIPSRVAKSQAVLDKQLSDTHGTWLLDPLPAPDFNLQDTSGSSQTLVSFSGSPLLLCFWSANAPAALDLLQALQRSKNDFSAKGVRLACINLDDEFALSQLRAFAAEQKLNIQLLLGTPEIAGVYNIIYRYLFDRRRDLPLPAAFLLDGSGNICHIYTDSVGPSQILSDAAQIPRTYAARLAKALPFSGTLYNGRFQRNEFTYGVALFQHGYLDEAAASFKQVTVSQPNNAEAFYNLGTLYLRKNALAEAQKFLSQTVSLKPDYPEAWNNLGMIAAQQNDATAAISNFRHSLDLRPNYVTAMLNLGNVFRRQGNLSEAGSLLSKAVELEPENAEANYSLGMFFAHQSESTKAESLLQKAVRIRPNYPDAINNLGVLFIRAGKNSEAEQQFKTCISVAPAFDQAYLNLAQLYVLEKQNDKARETLEALLKLQPQHKLARQALEMLH
jgi:Flp pilus assembly protein TadD/peroxiredoxin